jgi:hypothetical protein
MSRRGVPLPSADTARTSQPSPDGRTRPYMTVCPSGQAARSSMLWTAYLSEELIRIRPRRILGRGLDPTAPVG